MILLEVVATLAAARHLLDTLNIPWAQLLEQCKADLDRVLRQEHGVQGGHLSVDNECLRGLVKPNTHSPPHTVALRGAARTLGIEELFHLRPRCLGLLISARLAKLWAKRRRYVAQPCAALGERQLSSCILALVDARERANLLDPSSGEGERAGICVIVDIHNSAWLAMRSGGAPRL